MAQMTTAPQFQRQEISSLELVERTYRFIRYELVHAGIAVIVFGLIFLILKPWNNSYYTDDAHPFWFVGPPLIFFSLDLLFAMFLHFTLQTHLKPGYCLIWVACQIGNLILLTLLGFYMVWTFYYKGNTYLRLTLALIILYCFKSYRISQMHRLIIMMRARCNAFGSFGFMPNQNHHQNLPQNSPYIISATNGHVHIPMDQKPTVIRG